MRLDIKRLRTPTKLSVTEAGQHSYILEIKLLIYISRSHPHSQLHRVMRLESIHPALIFLLFQLILSL